MSIIKVTFIDTTEKILNTELDSLYKKYQRDTQYCIHVVIVVQYPPAGTINFTNIFLFTVTIFWNRMGDVSPRFAQRQNIYEQTVQWTEKYYYRFTYTNAIILSVVCTRTSSPEYTLHWTTKIVNITQTEPFSYFHRIKQFSFVRRVTKTSKRRSI